MIIVDSIIIEYTKIRNNSIQYVSEVQTMQM